ncbi:PepSY-associated TM helix domain-containing protein [Novosphingobium humi]|uniref:PepSY-associated TM helix domain-containing protein n=1 Tax=Novosphingobium humi TaxID=2282397 RepID=UPI0025B17B94|nr:PepSY-associated TM helix domain-containing protein [Novosphingobium humi]WJS98166.1 PepSY domain-containing protein [Novosphingobium humi]
MKLTRRTWIPVHRWSGLTLGLILLFSAFTGLGLAFRTQLEGLAYPGMGAGQVCAAPVAISRMAQTARQAHPQSKVDYLRVKMGSGLPTAVRFFDKETYYFNACNGSIVAQQSRYDGFFGFTEWLHKGAWIKEIGGIIMGIGALTCVLMLAGLGVYLWWPRGPRTFKQALRIDNRAKGKAYTLGLHRTVGAWAVAPLLLSAITGIPIAFEPLQKAMIGKEHIRLPGAPKTPAPKMAAGEGKPQWIPASDAVIDATWTGIMANTHRPSEVLFHIAHKPGEPLEIYAIDGNAPHTQARSMIYADPADGSIIKTRPYDTAPFTYRLYYWMLALHNGMVGGLLGQIILFLGCAGATFMGVTGIMSYLQTPAKKPRKVAAAPSERLA